MEKRTVLAIVISIVFILIWQKMVIDKISPVKNPENVVSVKKTVKNDTKPYLSETKKAVEAETTTPKAKELTDKPVQSEQLVDPLVDLSQDLPEEKVILENNVVKLTFTNRGGRLLSAKLKKYTDEHGNVMELVNAAMAARNLTPFSFEGDFDSLNKLGFQVKKDRNQVIFTYPTSQGKLVKDFELLDGYQLKIHVYYEGSTPIRLSLGPGIDSAEQSHGRYSTEDAVVIFADGSVDRIKKTALNNKEISKPKLQWVAIEDKYFAKIFTPEVKDIRILGFHQSYKGKEKNLLLSDLLITGKNIVGTIFIGPKDYDVLKKLGHGYDKIVNFGFFGVFAKWLFFALRWINGWVHNYGWTIILLTISIRLLIFPISQAGLRSMKDMQRVQPKMKEIQAKYKKYGKDLTKKQEMNREIQELYKKEGVSPLGGCLPMVLQIPIFFAFWSLLLNVIELRQASFIFWIKDLSAYDPYYVLPILMGVSQLISQMITPSTGDATQKKMMYALPVVFTVLLATAPSGLIVYWTTNNIFQIVQQMLVNRSMNEAVGE